MKSILFKIKKIFTLPTPVELGKSSTNSLPSRRLNHISNEYTWQDYDADLKKHYPIKYFFYEQIIFWIKYNIVLRLSQIAYWLKSHTYRRYHIIDIRSGHYNNYRYGWIDSDYKILLSNFKILCDFMEKEKPGENVNWYSDDALIIAWEELEDLYCWWIKERPASLAEANACKTSSETSQQLYKKDTEMLIRLIKVRSFMWT